VKIEISISEQMHKDLIELQSSFGLGSIEDLTVHAWQVLRIVSQRMGQDSPTLSSAAIQWILHPTSDGPPHEVSQGTKEISHAEMDTKILQEIHRLLEDDRIDQALKATQIYKLLKSKRIENSQIEMVKPEMSLAAAETFATECDPEKATQMIVDAGHEIPAHTHQRSEDTRKN
jgi:hypothetical protein